MNHVKNKDASANIRVDDFLAAHGGHSIHCNDNCAVA